MTDKAKHIDWGVFDVNQGLDHAAASEIVYVINNYRPVEKTFAYAAKNREYRDILRRAGEVDRDIEKEIGKSYNPEKSILDKIRYKTHRFVSGLFDSYTDDVFSMLMKKRPYKKGAVMNTVCESAVESFDENPEIYRDMIEDQYVDSKKVSHIALGIDEETDKKTLELLKEPETKKLMDDYKKYTTPSVLDVRLLSIEPERSFERLEQIEVINKEIVEEGYNMDPMLKSVPMMTYKAFELEIDEIQNFVKNTSSMDKFVRNLDKFLLESDEKRADLAIESATKLISEDLDTYDKKSIKMASTALPYDMDKVTEMMYDKYKNPTKYSKKEELSEMDWRGTVEK